MNKVIKNVLKNEKKRQLQHIELIASENFVSDDVLKAQGSVLTNKYAEGYPHKRYYGGCKFVDEAETEAIELACKLFGCAYANVQPHSGSSANMAVYRALLKPGDKILGMNLSDGGHLTHGYKINFSGMDYNAESYGVKKDGFIDYSEIKKIAKKFKPNIIVAGASAYSRRIDFSKFQEIAKEVGAYLVVDMAHIAGLVATGKHQNPCFYADVVTSTTHKTLRGPRGGLILTNNAEIAKKIDKVIFPGIQGGPLMHVIAAKAIAFDEALKPEFKSYIEQVVKNTDLMASEFIKKGIKVITEGTDNHLFLIDTKSSYNLTGKQAETMLGEVNITVNKNTIPRDTEKPFVTSGLRLGTPAITTRGFKEDEIIKTVTLIDETLKNKKDKKKIKKEVINLTKDFKLFGW